MILDQKLKGVTNFTQELRIQISAPCLFGPREYLKENLKHVSSQRIKLEVS